MEASTLGGVPGAGEARSRRQPGGLREYRGAFAFHAEHEPAIVQLLESGDLVEYEGPVDGQRRRLKARLTDLSLTTGMAYFQGSAE
jgi:hypothetical protein